MKQQKTTSFIRQINGHIQWPRFFRTLSADLGAALAALAGWCTALESQAGSLRLVQPRRISVTLSGHFIRQLRSLTYSFSPADSDAVCTVCVGPILSVLVMVLPVLLFLQLLDWSFGWSKHRRFLRGVLRPMNQAAQEAQRLAESGINRQQLHNMEQAINRVTDSQGSVHIGDADLEGVETAINQLLLRLRDSYEAQTRFVDDASHELRTPIAVIHGYSSMLDRWGKDDPATLEESVKAILEESEHMQTLVDQLLFLARGDGGRQQPELQPTRADELLRELAEESRMIDSEHEYVLREGDAVTVSADPAMLKQALRILLDNAAKYTPAGGRITLCGSLHPEGGAALSVQDEGIGLTQEEASHIFERFFRGSAARGSSKGSGLGLSIAKWIVDRHGGRIEVLGFEGVGTRMTVCLPLCEAADAENAASA